MNTEKRKDASKFVDRFHNIYLSLSFSKNQNTSKFTERKIFLFYCHQESCHGLRKYGPDSERFWNFVNTEFHTCRNFLRFSFEDCQG